MRILRYFYQFWWYWHTSKNKFQIYIVASQKKVFRVRRIFYAPIETHKCLKKVIFWHFWQFLAIFGSFWLWKWFLSPQDVPRVPKCISRELSSSLAKSEIFVKNWTFLGTACPHFVPHCLGKMAFLTSRNTNFLPRRWGTKCMKYYQEINRF